MSPHRSLPMCHIPGCPNKAVQSSLCQNHKKIREKEIEENRDPATRELYDYRWQSISKKYLLMNNWCIECLKKNEWNVATAVDHIISHRGNSQLFWDSSNWQPLCKRHHDAKTMREENQKRKAVGGG